MFKKSQTQLCMENFDCYRHDDIIFPFLQGVLLVKKSAASTNFKLKKINQEKLNGIQKSCDFVLKLIHEYLSKKSQDLKEELLNYFPISFFQSGSGTSINMNVNEVIAQISKKKMGIDLHPNDDVNMSQSSNDTIPTANRVVLVHHACDCLVYECVKIKKELLLKSEQFKGIIKTGRTHFQDADFVDLGSIFFSYASQVEYFIFSILRCAGDLLKLPQGGTAVGSCTNAGIDFGKLFCEELTSEYLGLQKKPCSKIDSDDLMIYKTNDQIKILSSFKFEPMDSFHAGISADNEIAMFVSTLGSFASCLHKISKDIIVLSSGPNCGIGEIEIPSNEAGSSIMPGKSNPTQCENLCMICMDVIGRLNSVLMSNMSGHMELNSNRTLVVKNSIDSLLMLTSAISTFTKKCVKGIVARKERILEFNKNNLQIAIGLSEKIGYDFATNIVQEAIDKKLPLKEVCVCRFKIMSEKEYDKMVFRIIGNLSKK